jgi:CheY-like chemotaxis protein
MASIRLRPIHPSAKTPEIPLARGDSKIVGRSEQADVIVEEPSLSRRHAQISVTAEGVVTVEDLGSTNHTFINDVQRKRGSLSSGDRIRFGSVEYELEKDVAPSDAGETTVLLQTDRMTAVRTLLVADDSATIRHFIELAFAAESIAVTGVGSGDQAIESIKSDPPDIVLADVDMPGKTGYDVVQFLRQSSRLAHIPILLLTDAAEADQAKAEAAGSDGVLGKPLDPHVVISRVKELIGKPRRVQPMAAASPAAAAHPPAPPIPVSPSLVAAFYPSKSAPPVHPPEPALNKTTAVPAHGAPAPAPPKAAAPVAPPPIERSPAPQPVAEAPVKPPAPPKPTLVPPLADVFAALVSATPHEPAMPVMPDPPPSARKDGPAVTDDLINEVMRRVVEDLSNRVVRETGPDIVSEIAERLVREEIDRIKSATK